MVVELHVEQLASVRLLGHTATLYVFGKGGGADIETISPQMIAVGQKTRKSKLLYHSNIAPRRCMLSQYSKKAESIVCGKYSARGSVREKQCGTG